MSPRPKVEPTTLGELLYWSYANLAMAHKAVEDGATKYGRLHFMIRARLWKGLREGTMGVGSMLDDERLKLVLPAHCAYCGSSERLSIDHLVPSASGGLDSGDNTVWACRSCNSSKGARDLLAWYAARGELVPLLLVRRYLKQCIAYVRTHGLLDAKLEDVGEVPFRLDLVPRWYGELERQRLWVVDLVRMPAKA